MPPSPTLFSTPCLLILESLPAPPFIPDSPFIYTCLICMFFISMTSISIYRLRFGSDVDKLPLYYLYSFCWYLHKIIWWFYFNEISNCCVFDSLPFIPTSPFINFGDFCQPPRLFHPTRLLLWPKFASLLVYSALPFYLKLESSWCAFWYTYLGGLCVFRLNICSSWITIHVVLTVI